MAEKHMTWHVAPTHMGKDFDIGAADGANIALVYGDEEVARLIANAPKTAFERDRLLAALEELLEVADLRGDADLPHPADDSKLWTARMAEAWAECRAATGEASNG